MKRIGVFLLLALTMGNAVSMAAPRKPFKINARIEVRIDGESYTLGLSPFLKKELEKLFGWSADKKVFGVTFVYQEEYEGKLGVRAHTALVSEGRSSGGDNWGQFIPGISNDAIETAVISSWNAQATFLRYVPYRGGPPAGLQIKKFTIDGKEIVDPFFVTWARHSLRRGGLSNGEYEIAITIERVGEETAINGEKVNVYTAFSTINGLGKVPGKKGYWGVSERVEHDLLAIRTIPSSLKAAAEKFSEGGR